MRHLERSHHKREETRAINEAFEERVQNPEELEAMFRDYLEEFNEMLSHDPEIYTPSLCPNQECNDGQCVGSCAEDSVSYYEDYMYDFDPRQLADA